jgi:hypothetical protein
VEFGLVRRAFDMTGQNIQGIFKTKGINPENGKPNVVALMFNESKGISLDGGAMAAGVSLGFGGSPSFAWGQWV